MDWFNLQSRTPPPSSLSELLPPGLVARLIIDTGGGEQVWLYAEEAGVAASLPLLGVFFRVDLGGYGEQQMPLYIPNPSGWTIRVEPVKVPLFYTFQRRDFDTAEITDHQGMLSGATWQREFEESTDYETINLNIYRRFNHAVVTQVP